MNAWPACKPQVQRPGRPEVRTLQPTQVVSALVRVPGWRLHGEGEQIAIEREWRFDSHAHAMLFVNQVGWLAESMNHHPELVLNHARCVVRWRTHDVGGLSPLDFEAARRTDELLGPTA